MEQEKIIKLTVPIPIEGKNGEPINAYEIKIGRFKAKHFRLLPKSFFGGKGKGDLSANEALGLLAGLSGLPQKTIDEIDLVDIEKVIGELTDFFEVCLSQNT